MVKAQVAVSRRFLLIALVSLYVVTWALLGASSLIARESLHHRYGKFIKVYSCENISDSTADSKMVDLNDVHLNYQPAFIWTWTKPFFLYKGFVYYVNYKTHESDPNSIGAGSGTVTAWGHIKVDSPGDGFYGCGL